jgi:hypothetical protein
MTYAKVSLNFGMGTSEASGVAVAEEVGIEVVKKESIDERIDVEVGMMLLSPAEELSAVVEKTVESVEETVGALVASTVSVGKTVVY